jgi:hypothetical protein
MILSRSKTSVKVSGWFGFRPSGGGISVHETLKGSSRLERLQRLDRELWQWRADVGAPGEPNERLEFASLDLRAADEPVNTTK